MKMCDEKQFEEILKAHKDFIKSKGWSRKPSNIGWVQTENGICSKIYGIAYVDTERMEDGQMVHQII
jgi:hypothetical protein